eukprot:CAMPEP_0182490296 /NCGR_PEP_ID=MMETSP1321-20130603/211_1 /TAXON_ID=91990 /ORGANISM="Bolidomonas sp., Strain RCC1657" /LENGTH=282 /DNA_ID=CAMNT_0024692457 /DNA_START=203 /DNA_END=1051 /DNA_ORIENTATION=+
MSPVKSPVKSLGGQHVFLLPLKEPHTDVPGDDDFVLQVSEPPDLLHLLVDVLLVFDDVGFACEHARRRGVLGADVDDGELPSGLEDAPDFSEHLVPSCPGRLVERVHDGDEVKGSLLEERFFCVSSDEAQEVAGGLGEGLERMVEAGFEAGVRRLHFGHCEHLRGGVQPHNYGLVLVEALGQGPRRYSNSTAHVEDVFVSSPDSVLELSRYFLPNAPPIVGEVVDERGRDGGAHGVHASGESSVAERVDALVEPVVSGVLDSPFLLLDAVPHSTVGGDGRGH